VRSSNPVLKALRNLVVIVGSVSSIVGIFLVVGLTITNAVIGGLLSALFVTANTAYILWKGGAKAGGERLSAYYDIAFGDSTNWLPWMVGVDDSRYAPYQRFLDRFCRATPHLDPADRDEHLSLVVGLRDQSKVGDKDAFVRRYYEFRTMAKEKYQRMAKASD